MPAYCFKEPKQRKGKEEEMTEKEQRTIIVYRGETVKALATFGSAFGGQLPAYPGG